MLAASLITFSAAAVVVIRERRIDPPIRSDMSRKSTLARTSPTDSASSAYKTLEYIKVFRGDYSPKYIATTCFGVTVALIVGNDAVAERESGSM